MRDRVRTVLPVTSQHGGGQALRLEAGDRLLCVRLDGVRNGDVADVAAVCREQHLGAAWRALIAGQVDAVACHQFTVAAEHGLAVQRGLHALARLLADVFHRAVHQHKARPVGLGGGLLARLVGSEDGLCDRVRGCAFARGSEPQQFVLVDLCAVCGNNILHDKVALGDRAGFIHDNGFHIIQRLERRAALEQDAAPRARADACKIGQRHAEHERARAGNDEEGERGVDPLAPVAGDKAGYDSGQQGDAYDRGGVNAGEAGDKAVDLGFARSGVLHAVQDALHHALREHMGDAQFNSAVRVDATRDRAVARSDAHRHRLARDR